MKSMRECLNEAKEKGSAIGHFNASSLEMVWGIFRAARNINVPVIVGFSEGERDFVGVKQAVDLVKSIRAEFDYPIFVNADHTYSLERALEAVRAGFDSIIIDGSELAFDDNVKMTKKFVEEAKSINSEIIIEGEVGFIGKSSKILQSIPEGVSISLEHLTKPEEAQIFVKETGIDLLAPAVGNIHGMLKGGKDPNLNIGRIKEISEAVKIPLVLHGGSGNSSEDFIASIKEGVRIVHVSTELRVAYRRSITLALQENPEELAPYKYLKGVSSAIEKVVSEKLKIFSK
jgi:fructose-bisphosphate aldolase class II